MWWVMGVIAIGLIVVGIWFDALVKATGPKEDDS